jgi:hypothetical protein
MSLAMIWEGNESIYIYIYIGLLFYLIDIGVWRLWIKYYLSI